MKDTLTLYNTMKSQSPDKTISLEGYCGFVKHGAYQDLVLQGRAVLSKAKVRDKSDPNYLEYKRIKSLQACVTGSAVMKDGAKVEANIKSLNGYIVIDIDTEVPEEMISALKYDKYTRVIHRSFGGDGICIFVKINQLKDFRDSFTGLAQYYLDNYNVTVDASCSNPNRLRYLSYDPDLWENPKSSVFTHKAIEKAPKPKEMSFVYSKDDLDFIFEQIKEKGIDLCEEDYSRYVRIGMSLANKFGESGREKFHFVCSYGGKYNSKHTDRDYTGFVKSNSGKCTIATFYYYCKEAGLTIYSEKTKQIINRVKVSKAQGNPTVESIAQNMYSVHGVTVNESDTELIKELIESKVDYSKEANDGTTDTERLISFIVDTVEPSIDVITGDRYFLGVRKPIEDEQIEDLYLKCKINMDFKVFKNDVETVIRSSHSKKIDKLTKFLKDNAHNETGYIEAYARLIEPYDEYNVWAFKKWVVGMLHNWTADFYDREVSPLTLVLTGKGGKGKSSFFRYMLPDELVEYHIERKLKHENKDHRFLLCSRLLVVDEEFGGAIKSVKDYKSFSDIVRETDRRPFEKNMKTMRRRAGLGGNSNEDDVLQDVTGNRRILPIKVKYVKYDELIAFDTTKMLVEAYNELRSPDFDWRIYKEEEINYLKEKAQSHESVMPIEEIFDKFFSLVPDKHFTVKRIMNQGDIMDFLHRFSIVKPTKYDIKDIIAKKELEYKLHHIAGNEKKKGFELYINRANSDETYKLRAEE